MPYIVTTECIQCGACAAGCESGAITEGETQSHIDITLCVECGTCERNCPMDAIIYISDDEYNMQSVSQAGGQSLEKIKDGESTR